MQLLVAAVLIGGLPAQNTAGQNTAGQNTAGQNTAGQNPGGQNPGGQNPGGPGASGVTVATQGEGDGQLSKEVAALQNKRVHAIQVERYQDGGGQPSPVDPATSDSLVRNLESRVGQPFDARLVKTDCQSLWLERRLVVTAYAEEVDGEVDLTFVVEREISVYEGVEFRGLVSLERSMVDSLLGIHDGRQVTSNEAEAMRKVLLSRYHREGFAFCSIELRPVPIEVAVADDPATPVPNRMQFVIDEGAKVTVRNAVVVGNESFPVRAIFGFAGTGSYLLRDSHIQSDPSWGFSRGGAFSREILEEDLDRLRLFYRSRGFLDATVDIADAVFTADRGEVDITIVVVEGERYRIRSIEIEHVNQDGSPLTAPPLYSAEEIQAELAIEPGEYYDHAKLQRDWLEIQEFYGERGHPPSNFPGMRDVAGACQVGWPPVEIYGEGAEVDVTFLVVEGVPKTLRDVVIRGNQFTRDPVVRRQIRVLPGERIDMREVRRAQRSLEQTGYFSDRHALIGPRVEFQAVPGEQDVVDLAVEVEDGMTGELRWGVGISTGQGMQASMTYNKRNFDLWAPPSSWNPITAIGEILDNRAFHGGGQTLGLLLAPGSRYSQFRIQWTDPDFFNDHFETWNGSVAGERLIRREPNGYTSDTLGAEIGLGHNFTEEFNVSLGARQETVEIDDLAPDATAYAFDAEGSTEMRGLRLSAQYRDLDNRWRPTSGVDLAASVEMIGGPLGGGASLYKFIHRADAYLPLRENEMKHRTVLHFDHYFGVAEEFGDSDHVFLTERFYMGGRNLRGFDYRDAGPSQFGRPVGGEAMYTASLELTFPLVATRLENEVRDRELLRFAVFTDFGLLGLGLGDSTFGEPRLSSGVGLRIEIPLLEVPIALDVAWPWMYEESDDRRQFFFWISR
ncbi:MAG: BamA/TamA family outer membrane protein [Planctomycetes bacterium]|nr:BamA/TamA family outer membrane protein [Planctomycetota bacterium]